jgi:TP901 family phage tail tape measure protein
VDLLANQDDLSVNINVGLNLDQQKVNKVKEELQFILELQKELGVEGVTKVRVGGYSTSESPDRTVRNRAASKIEKMGGDWSGIDIADKAQTELAKQFNQASQELAKIFNIDFIPDFASSIGEIDFALPDNSMPAEKIKQAIEDFVMNAAGEVTVSPAMFLAAAEKVMKNNPNLSVPRGMDALSGITKPTLAFGNVANYDEKLSKEFQDFIAGVVDNNTADKISEFLLSKLKVLFSGIIDDAQKARERVFSSVSSSEGEDSAENIIRYADDAARRAIANAEQKYGLQAGTTAMYAGRVIPEKFKDPSGPETNKFNENLFKGMKTPLSNPSALLNIMVGEYQDQVTGAIMAAVPDPSKVAAPIAQILMNPYILGDKFATGYQDEINKAIKKRVPQVAEATTPVASATRGGGATNPDIDLLRKYLTEQKALVEQSGKTFMVGLDTEFNSQISEKLTELSAVIQDGSGKFVEIFKFLQLPGDLDAMMRGWEQLPKAARAGQAKDAAGLAARGGMLGIPKEDIGVPDDAEANFMQFRGKISKLVDVINLLNDLGIQLTGSNFAAAEGANIKKAIDYVNSMSTSRGLEPVGMPDLSNVFDPAKMAQKLSGGSAELAKIFDSPEAKKGVSGALGHLIRNIAEQFPDFIAQYSDQFKPSDSGSFQFKAPGGAAPAHYAVTDATASLIVKDFIEQMGNTAATLIIPVAKDLNTKVQAASGGSGGGKPPSGGVGAADKPEDDPFSNRAAESIQKLLLTGQKYENAITGLTENEIIKVNQRLAVLQKSAEQAELLGKIAELEKKRSDILVEAAQLSAQSSQFSRERSALREEGPQGPLTQGDAASAKRYNEQIRAATQLGTQIRELEEAGRSREKQVISSVKEEARHNQVSEQLTDNFRKQYDANLQNAQAGKTATSMIKAQMQEQVNAQKEVQRQTQSLMNTWVTSRYALYDVGNFYGNVAQRLFQLTREIFNTTDSLRRFETAFTSVERAMQLPRDAADDLRNQFVLLSETIPVSFEEISKIATLGAQMGITAKGIVGFTETVAQFASVTGISADTVAQQFGRIAELADVDSTQFVNLGSAVTYAGINAVATESEILTLSQSIAAVSNQVGITAPEIIGLGTALASVGIPAEQARGVFTRVFADIDRAASTGGESLQNLAEITGMSAEQIQASWGTEGAANQVFTALLDGLNASDNLTASFDKLNIVETREINTLTRLAKNMNVVNQALNDSSMAYDDASFLGESFGKTIDNTDAKILLFKNNLDSLFSVLSQGFVEGPGGLNSILDGASEVLKFLKSLEDSLLFTAVLPMTAGLLAFGGVLAGLSSVIAKVTAQVYAFRVATINAANDPTAVSGFAAQIRSLTGLGSGIIEMREKVEGVNTRGLVEPVDLGGRDGAGIFAGQAKQNKYLLEKRNIYVALGDAVEKTDAAEVAGATNKIQLARLQADLVNKAISQQREMISVEESALDKLVTARTAAVSSGAKGQALLLDSEIATQTQKIKGLKTEQLYITFYKGEAVVINENTLAQYKNAQASTTLSTAKKTEQIERAKNATAINLETKAASRASAGFMTWLGRIGGFIAIATTVITVVDAIATAIGNLNKINLLEGGGGLESFREAIRQDTKDLASGAMPASDVVATAIVEQKTYKQVVDESAGSIGNFTGVSKEFTDGFKTTTEEIEKQTVALGTNTKEWLANAIFQNEKLQEWMNSNPDIFNQMQESMAQTGISFDELIQGFVAKAQGVNINPLAKVETNLKQMQTRADQLRGIIRTTVKQVYTITPDQKKQADLAQEELNGLNQKIDLYIKIIALANEMGSAITGALDMQNFQMAIAGALGISDGLEEAEKEAQNFGGGAAKAIKTLTDWVGELSSVLQAAFDIRYGQEIGLDAISSSWIELRKAAEDAEKAVKSANDEINKSYADQDVLEYQLSVAERYGDEKRAAVLRAKLSELDTKIIEQQQQLEDANNASSKSLVGNSRASIDNRAKVRDLVTQYNSYLVALANTGMSSEDLKAQATNLKQEFLNQGTALGFAESELSSYTTAFEQDFTTVINNLPRDYTLNVDTDPALRAVNEFLAKVNNSSGTVTIKSSFDPSKFELTAKPGGGGGGGGGNIAFRFLKDGGLIEGAGSPTSDSIPAMLSDGEYVVRAKSVSAYGLDFMNALNEQRVGFNPASQSSSGSVGGGSSVVYLSPEDRALLRSVVDRPVALYTENTKIAQSANAGNVLLAQRGSK